MFQLIGGIQTEVNLKNLKSITNWLKMKWSHVNSKIEIQIIISNKEQTYPQFKITWKIR